MYIHLAFYRCVKRRILCRFVAAKHAVFHSSFRRIATRSIYLLASLMYWLLQYCSKESYPPLRETRLVSREFTGSTNTSHSSVFETGFVYLDVCIVSYRVAQQMRFSFSSAMRVYHVCIINSQASIITVSFTLPKRFLFKSDFPNVQLLQIHVHDES